MSALISLKLRHLMIALPLIEICMGNNQLKECVKPLKIEKCNFIIIFTYNEFALVIVFLDNFISYTV